NILYIVGSDDGGGSRHRHREQMGEFAHNLTGHLSFFSIDGINIAMGKAVLGTNGSVPFGAMGNQPMVPAPFWPLMLFISFAVCALCLFIAWARIRAVEVVG